MGGDPMPLIRYFGFVGTGLVLLLVGLDWYFPQPTAESPGSVSNGPTIRIASAEQLPERVVIDTSLPTIVPPTTVVEFAERWPQTTVAYVSAVAKPAIPPPVNETRKKQQNTAKREPPKKVAARREAPKMNIGSAKNEKMPAATADTSLLDRLKEGLGQTQTKLMTSLEPLTAYVSKLRPETR
jgi:hypothetical protein